LAADPLRIPISLYVHLPWCERKCPYCDFNSHEQLNPEDEAPYIDALLEDLRIQHPAALNRELASIFIGGGTPSLFSGDSVARLLAGIDEIWGISHNTEITLEANPGSSEVEKFRAYKLAGVTRLSIGVQSFDDTHLSALGRIHRAADARSAASAAAQIFADWNIDLMHGLPGQTPEQALADLTEGIALCGHHLSWYQLTIEPNTRFWSNPPLLPEEDDLSNIQDAGASLLVALGMEQYEVSAWAAKGRLSRHNMNYWQFGDYMGIGAGAHGKITTHAAEVIRTQRSRLPKDYVANIKSGAMPITREIPPEELPAEFMMNALRLRDGVDTQLFTERTGLPMSIVADIKAGLCDRQLLIDAPDRFQATDLGYRFLNSVTAAFLAP